jgi:hypothetical protein
VTEAPKDPLDAIIVGEFGRWAKGKTVENLEIVIENGEPLYPDAICKIDFEKRALVDHPVYLRVPSQLRDGPGARRGARLPGRPRQDPRDKFDEETAIKFFGRAQFEHTENLHILERSIRRRGDPKRVYMIATELDRNHPAPALMATLDKLAALRKIVDARLTEAELTDEKTFWSVVGGIAKTGNLSPLVVIAGQDLDSFLTSMAARLWSFQTASSSPPSSESSTSTG